MGEMVGSSGRRPPGLPGEVESFLQRAAAHPLGHEFVTRGSPDAISATFGVHAFVVDAAREALRANFAPPTVDIPRAPASLRPGRAVS